MKWFTKVGGFSLLLLFIAAYVAVPAQAGKIVRPAAIAVDGKYVNQLGQRDVFGGANITPTSKYATKVAALGGSVVRLRFCWSAIEHQAPTNGAHHYDLTEIQKVTHMVATLHKQHVKVIADSHETGVSPYFGGGCGMPNWVPQHAGFSRNQKSNAASWQWTSPSYRKSYLAFWKMMANRLRSYPNVIGYEIYNEPHGLPSTHAGTQRIVGFDCYIAAGLQQVDPLRSIVFMLRSSGDLGLLHANLSCMSKIKHPVLDLHFPDWGKTRFYTPDGEDYRAGQAISRVYNHPKWMGTKANICADLHMIKSLANQKAHAAVIIGEYEDYNSKGVEQIKYVKAVNACAYQNHISTIWMDGSNNPKLGMFASNAHLLAGVLSKYWHKLAM